MNEMRKLMESLDKIDEAAPKSWRGLAALRKAIDAGIEQDIEETVRWFREARAEGDDITVAEIVMEITDESFDMHNIHKLYDSAVIDGAKLRLKQKG